jgi:hypothetical protein
LKTDNLAFKEAEAKKVFDRLSKKLIGLVAVSVLGTAAWAQAPKAPAVKDQGEYDIAQKASKETDPQKKLDLLKEWEQKYPDSDFKGQRQMTIASAESQIAVKALQPGATPADVAAAQKAAQDLIDNLDKYLAAENKPPNVSDDQWKQAKSTIEVQAHSVLASVAASKKDDATAEAEYKKVLTIDPNSASTAYSLGTLIYRTKNVQRFPEAFFWIARSIEISGQEALTPQGKAAADKFLTDAYKGYHGDAAGLDDVKKTASSATSMPAGFTIQSQVDIANGKAAADADFAKSHPDIALWQQIRDALKAEGGDTYFTQIKDAEIPPAGQAFMMFSAKVVSQPSPKELLVNVDSAMGDATLKFENPLKGTVDPGTALKFKGVVDAFTKEPYMLSLNVEKEDIDGLPASVFSTAPSTRKKRPAAKK